MAKEGSFDIANYTPEPDSYGGILSGLTGGHRYLVQGEVTATAQPPDSGNRRDRKNIDELSVPDSADLFIPLDE